MKLVKGGVAYILPSLSSLEKKEFNVRSKAVDKAAQHGGVLSGDGKIDSRTIAVEAMIMDGDYQAQVDELMRYAYRRDQRLYISDTRYVNVACLTKCQESFYDGYYQERGKFNLAFLAIDPFFYSDVPNVSTITVATSPKQITINNPGNVDTPAKITIIATAAATAITLINQTDSNRRMDYADPQMIAGQVLGINTVTGAVERGGVNTINNFSGTFLSLLPGDNVLEYTGGACTFQVDFTARWL